MINRDLRHLRIVEKLGEGGMGTVYRGIDTMLEREVAVKSLKPELARRKDIVERFRTEAVALAKLNHPNVMALYGFEQQGGDSFMVLEYVHGRPLDHVLAERGPLPWREASYLLCQALEGLAHAHRAGLVHRDLKPGNMMVTPEGTLKLMDFGISRIVQRARLTQVGHLVGTLEYMSPEQVRGEETDGRSDLYAMGIVLFELITGRVPFEGRSDYDLIRAQVETPPPPPRHFSTAIPALVEQVVLRALAKDPGHRFQSAQEFVAELRRVEHQLAVEPGTPAAYSYPLPAPTVTHAVPAAVQPPALAAKRRIDDARRAAAAAAGYAFGRIRSLPVGSWINEAKQRRDVMLVAAAGTVALVLVVTAATMLLHRPSVGPEAALAPAAAGARPAADSVNSAPASANAGPDTGQRSPTTAAMPSASELPAAKLPASLPEPKPERTEPAGASAAKPAAPTGGTPAAPAPSRPRPASKDGWGIKK